MQSKEKKFFIFALLIGAFVVFWIFLDRAKETQSPVVLDEGGATISDEVGGKDNGAEENIQPSQEGEGTAADENGENETTNKEAPYPNLSRTVPSGANSEMRSEIARLSGLLREDDGQYAVWLDLASYRRLVGDYDGAEEIWMYMRNRWPIDHVPPLNLADLFHYYKKDYPRAETFYKEAIAKKSAYPISYLHLFELYARSYKEKENEAVGVLRQGIENNPDDISLLAALGEYYEEKGDSINARIYYEKVVAAAETQGYDDVASNYRARLSNL